MIRHTWRDSHILHENWNIHTKIDKKEIKVLDILSLPSLWGPVNE